MWRTAHAHTCTTSTIWVHWSTKRIISVTHCLLAIQKSSPTKSSKVKLVEVTWMGTRSSRHVASCSWVWPPLEWSSTTQNLVKKKPKKKKQMLWSLICMLHTSLLLFGFVFGCLAYDFRQVEKKNAFLSLHVFFIHILWSRRSFEFGEFEDGFIAWETQPQQTNWSSCWPWDFFF